MNWPGFVVLKRSVVGSLLLGQLKNFGALSSFNPGSLIGENNALQKGRTWEKEVKNLKTGKESLRLFCNQ